jgi:hypothetical protein
MRTIIANKTWITLLSLTALVIATFVSSYPAMGMSNGDIDPLSPCGMTHQPSSAHHMHHGESAQTDLSNQQQCPDSQSDSSLNCCTTLCGMTLGFTWSFITPGESLSRFSKRAVDPFEHPVQRIEHLERPPSV